MQTPPTVTFHGVRYPAVLETDVRTRLSRLEKYYPSIVSARVRVDLSGRHKDGNRYRVLVELGVPGRDVIVAHSARVRPGLIVNGRQRLQKQDEADAAHRHARIAIREAFEAARRRLQDYARKRREKK